MPVKPCTRCSRAHTGICCIPGYSTMRNPGLAVHLSLGKRGAHPDRIGANSSGLPGKVGGYDKVAERKKGIKKQMKRETLLETLLGLNREWQVKVKAMLKQVTSEMPEYSQLQERLEKLLDSEIVLLRQLATRK